MNGGNFSVHGAKSGSVPDCILVSDFDGTMTRHDFYDLVRKHWPVPPDDDPWEQYVAGRITHFEALAEIFSRIRTDETTLLGLVDSMELDKDLSVCVDTLRTHDWDVVVASAGCEWYIRHLLGRAGVAVEIHANPGQFQNGGGLRMSLPEHSVFFNRMNGIDKVGVVRDAMRRGRQVAFAGDGRPDLEAALLVDPERRFARGWLAGALRSQGQPFQPFENWRQIVNGLVGKSNSPFAV